MSRLSRFKKGTVVKLPPMTSKVEKFDGNLLNDDDDFQDEFPKRKPPPSMITEVSVEKAPKAGSSKDAAVESVYFNSDGNIAISKSDIRSESEENLEKEEEKVDNVKQLKPKTKRDRKKKPATVKDELLCSFLKDDENEEIGSDTNNKVVCPFCWKKLSDKLTGTTHVKACGKNLPTERIFEALQLHERQVKEWEGLGIAYPGFATSNAKTSGKTKNSKPRSRSKKTKDPELELAMALSFSLHEEIETRKLKEKQFLVESGLEKEAASLEPAEKDQKKIENVVSYRQRIEKKPKMKLPKMLPGQVSQDEGGKRRKKNINLKDTKLYTTTETERQNIINERVGVILEERINAVEEEYYVRDKAELPSDVPKRLKPFHKENFPLWKLAELDNENESPDQFVIQDIVESKIRNESEVAKAVIVPDDDNVPKFRSDYLVESADKVLFRVPAIFPPISSSCDSDEHVIYTQKKMLPLSKKISLPLTPKSSSSSTSPDLLHSQGQDHSDPHYPRVVQDLLKMLSRRSFTDIILFGREEKPIKCHKLLLRARCPKILENVAQVRSSTSGTVREMISLVGYSHETVKAFVTFIYSGHIKRSLKSEDLVELKEMAEKFGVELASDEPPRKRVKTVNTEIQTDAVAIEMNSSFTQTEDFLNLDTTKDTSTFVANVNIDADQSLDDIFDRSEVVVEGNCLIDRKSHANTTSNPNAAFDDTSDKLFQNMADPHSFNPDTSKEMIFENAEEDNGNISEDLFGESDDDAFFNEIALDLEKRETLPSPGSATRNCSAKKRTRSISQHSDSSVTSFSATQAALYWRKQLNKKNSVENTNLGDHQKNNTSNNKIASPSIKQCIKKSRVDTNTSDNESDNEGLLDRNIVDDVDVIVIDDSDNENDKGKDDETNDSPKENLPADNIESGDENPVDLDMSLSWEDTYANINLGVSQIENNTSLSKSPCKRQSVIFDTPKGCFSRSVQARSSSSRYSLENARNHETVTCYSPLKSVNHSKLSFLDRSNPNNFGDHDDSVFAKIPDELLFDNHAGEGRCVFIPEPEVSPITTNYSSSLHKSNRSKGRAKSQANGNKAAPTRKDKEKAPAKGNSSRNKRRGKSYSQEPESTCRTPSTNTNTDIPDGRTPMLNYSTIDTPILKNELKKYGLKPLPRSKAKVMLRHIYTETHK